MKGLAKFLVALTLLAVVVGVSYLQTRSDATNETAQTALGAPVEAQRSAADQPGDPATITPEREQFTGATNTDTTTH
ncbi:MAG TPA: hypothetical protein VLB27_00105, partial [candidate division Zixibacteria bacterium]|nr:hypothetical protein [candidate division Zixibacteria bacterium]